MLKNKQPISSLYANSANESDSKEEKARKLKNMIYERKRIEDVTSLKDLFIVLGWIKKDVTEEEQYAQMINQLNFIESSKDIFIKNFLEKDPDLREFMAVHSTDATKRQFFLPTIKAIRERVVKIPNDPNLISIIKEFEGSFIKIAKYPISITFDGIYFAVKDLLFEFEEESQVDKWKNAPILVL